MVYLVGYLGTLHSRRGRTACASHKEGARAACAMEHRTCSPTAPRTPPPIPYAHCRHQAMVALSATGGSGWNSCNAMGSCCEEQGWPMTLWWHRRGRKGRCRPPHHSCWWPCREWQPTTGTPSIEYRLLVGAFPHGFGIFPFALQFSWGREMVFLLPLLLVADAIHSLHGPKQSIRL